MDEEMLDDDVDLSGDLDPEVTNIESRWSAADQQAQRASSTRQKIEDWHATRAFRRTFEDLD